MFVFQVVTNTVSFYRMFLTVSALPERLAPGSGHAKPMTTIKDSRTDDHPNRQL